MLVYQRVHGAPPWTLRFFHGGHGVLALTVTGGHPRCARLHLLRRSGLEVGGIGETRMVFNWLFRLFVEDDILPNCMEMKLLQGFLLLMVQKSAVHQFSWKLRLIFFPSANGNCC